MPTLQTYNYAINEESMRRGFQTLRHSHSIVPGEPVHVGHDRQLLMDWHVVDDLNGTFRSVQQPTKHPANPLIADDPQIDPLGPTSFGSVIRDRASGKFRMWTVSTDPEILARGGKGAPGALNGVYFESDDGIEWRRPDLGLFEHAGTKANNVFLHAGLDNLFVLELPERMHDRGRYGMVYCDNLRGNIPDPDTMHGMRHLIAFSEGGIRWQAAPENPVWVGRNDTNTSIVYNPERDVFMMYRRATINAGEIRRIAYAESADLLSWSQPTTIIRRDELDPIYLYGMPVSPYNQMYFGYLLCLWGNPHPEEPLPNGRDFKMDTQLTWSRDGVHWERHPERPTFIANSVPNQGAYDWGHAQGMANMIEVGDEIHIYFGGRPYLHKPGDARSDMPRTINLATLQRDRLVAIEATEDGGYMLTRPLAYTGGRLRINARTKGPDGFIKVAVREGRGERDGEWPEGWRFDDSSGFSGDSLNHIIRWRGGESLGAFPSSTVRLHFWLEDAQLYSFWFD